MKEDICYYAGFDFFMFIQNITIYLDKKIINNI